jgi:hypothetical protein
MFIKKNMKSMKNCPNNNNKFFKLILLCKVPPEAPPPSPQCIFTPTPNSFNDVRFYKKLGKNLILFCSSVNFINFDNLLDFSPNIQYQKIGK